MNSSKLHQFRHAIGEPLVEACLGIAVPCDNTSGLKFPMGAQESQGDTRGYHDNHNDNVIERRDDIYTQAEKKKEAYQLISSILYSAKMNDEYQDYYGIANGYDGVLYHPYFLYRPICEGMDHEELDGRSARTFPINERKGRGRRKSNSKRVPATVEDCIIESHNPFEPHVKMPLPIYRRMLYSEIDSKAREIHHYYDFHCTKSSEERTAVLRDLICSQDSCRKLLVLLAEAKVERAKCEENRTRLEMKLETLKVAKKRRRQAKKQRKTENITVFTFDITNAATDDISNTINSKRTEKSVKQFSK